MGGEDSTRAWLRDLSTILLEPPAVELISPPQRLRLSPRSPEATTLLMLRARVGFFKLHLQLQLPSSWLGERALWQATQASLTSVSSSWPTASISQFR